MKKNPKQLRNTLLFSMAVFCFSHTAKSEPFYWNAFDLKVKSQNVTPLLELLDETFTFSDKPFKVTLAEYVFSNDDRTHGLDLSSSNIDALSSVMDSDDIKTERDQFKKRFYDIFASICTLIKIISSINSL